MRKILLFTFLISIISCSEKATEINPTQKKITEKAKNELLSLLKDPTSANFVDSLTTYSKAVNLSKDTIYMVNLVVEAKNSYGNKTKEDHTASFTKDSLNEFKFWRIGRIALKKTDWKFD